MRENIGYWHVVLDLSFSLSTCCLTLCGSVRLFGDFTHVISFDMYKVQCSFMYQRIMTFLTGYWLT